MPDDALNDDVRAFLDETIDSLPQLEVILFLHQESSRAFTIDQVAAHVGVSAASAEQKLIDLKARHLVACTGRPPTYRLVTENNPVVELLPAVAQAYASTRLAVLHVVSERSLWRMRIFADAFRQSRSPR